MMDILNGFLSFFVPLFLLLVYYWYISIPVVALVIFGYIKTKNEGLKRALRIFLAFIILAVVGILIMMITNG
uniref:hypothetical protein n=1 Tax=uncultured Dysgonomonas sp. TaxID=206096 RepID=UPI00260693B4|nr:hypothetical protein [uncultured Dysgonomonas sp.]